MSDATDRLRAFLTISPSVVFPDEVLELFEPVEKEVTRLSDENATLRELCKSMRCALVGHDDKVYLAALDDTLVDTGFDLQKLGIEVD